MISGDDPVYPTPLDGGVTLRVYLAAHAPVDTVMGYADTAIKTRAAAAVAWADALIEELNK